MEITKIGEEIFQSVKRCPNEPIYYIGMYSERCTFQVLINDMPIWSFFDKGGMSGTMLPINSMVPKSGQQNVTIKVFPSYMKNNELASTIGSDAQVQITLAVTDWKNKMPMKVINKILILLPVVNEKHLVEECHMLNIQHLSHYKFLMKLAVGKEALT